MSGFSQTNYVPDALKDWYENRPIYGAWQTDIVSMKKDDEGVWIAVRTLKEIHGYDSGDSELTDVMALLTYMQKETGEIITDNAAIRKIAGSDAVRELLQLLKEAS